MKDETLSKVEEFMKAGKQEINSEPVSSEWIKENKELIKLRLRLSIEELGELIQALGLQKIGARMLGELVDELNQEGNTEPDMKAAVDALVDMRYVNNGFISTLGLVESFETNFDVVQESNMSKFPTSEKEAKETVKAYADKGIETDYEKSGDLYIVTRKSDGKILKSVKYTPAKIELVSGKSSPKPKKEDSKTDKKSK